MASLPRNILLLIFGVSLLLLPLGVFAQTPLPNQSPLANDDTAATEQNASVEINVVTNDSDPDQVETPEGTLNLADVTFTTPANGSLAYDGVAGTFTYTPNLDFIGTDSFTYTICDSATPALCSDPATVTIVVAIGVDVNVIPQKLNVKKMGVLPVVILGTADFDVTTIDPASIRLEGVAPLRSNVEDVEVADGFKDLALKFSAQEIVAAIVAALGEVFDGDVVVLHLTGNLKADADGNPGDPIAGEDAVIILNKGKPKPPHPPKGPKTSKGHKMN